MSREMINEIKKFVKWKAERTVVQPPEDILEGMDKRTVNLQMQEYEKLVDG